MPIFEQEVPDIDSSGLLNGGDIAILVITLVGTIAVGIVATIHAGEDSLLTRLCCRKSTNANDTEDATVGLTPKEPESSYSLTSDSSPTTRPIGMAHDTGDDGDKQNQARNFFLADRGMNWALVGGSLFASNIGGEHFVGMAGDGARRGLAVAMYEWFAAILIVLLGWVFSPIYRRAGVYTTPEYLQYRFNAGCRHYLSFITVIMYVLTKLSASIYGGAVIMQATLGWNLYAGSGACVLLSALFTIGGGLRAVMYTDLFQMIIFVVGGFVVLGVGLHQVGGFDGIEMNLNAEGRGDFWHLFKPVTDEDYPWTGMLIGQPIGSVWYWCMDQNLVQRVLSAKDTSHAKAGTSLAAVLKLLPPFMIVIPGIIASIMYDMSAADSGADAAYPVLLTNVMPHGVIGLMIASIIMAMMSSLSSVFSAAASVITNDIYMQFRPQASHTQLVMVGRVSTVVLAILSFCWIPILSNGDGLYNQVVEIQSYLTPPIGIVLILGVVWERTNGPGALTAMLCGGAFGFIRLIFLTIVGDDKKGQYPTVIDQFFYMNFQHFAILLWGIAMVVCILVSLLTKPNDRDVRPFMIDWSSIFKLDESEKRHPMYINHLVTGSTVVALLLTFTLWIYFA